jgi:hypothetical protein
VENKRGRCRRDNLGFMRAKLAKERWIWAGATAFDPPVNGNQSDAQFGSLFEQGMGGQSSPHSSSLPKMLMSFLSLRA